MTSSVPEYYKEELHYAEYIKRLQKWGSSFRYEYNRFVELLPAVLRSNASELYRMPPCHDFTLYAAEHCKSVEEVIAFKENFIRTCERVSESKIEWYFGCCCLQLSTPQRLANA